MSFRDAWSLDPDVVFLNHGSFGATPRAILEEQQRLRDEIERQPVRFFAGELIPRLAEARARAADFVGADPDNFAFVDNATTGVNAVLRSLDLRPDDEILVTNHEYNATKNAIDFVAERAGAHVVVVPIDLPITGPDAVVEAVVAGVTDRTRLFVVDHITSQTGIVMPVSELVAEMSQRGIETLIDGAHGPGMLPLDLAELGATYYTGNFHKWACAPKAAACLVVDPDVRHRVRPVSISHGANQGTLDERFINEFSWTGTRDPTPELLVPAVIDHLENMIDGGWPAIYARNHDLAVQGRRRLLDVVGSEPIAPESMLGSLASIRLPDSDTGDDQRTPGPPFDDPIQTALVDDHGIEVPVFPWPAPPHRMLRISMHLYNELADVERLADALETILSQRADR